MVVHLRNPSYKGLPVARWLSRSLWRLKYLFAFMVLFIVLVYQYQPFQNLEQFRMYMHKMLCFCGENEVTKTRNSLLVNTPYCTIPDRPLIDQDVCCLYKNMTLQTIDCEYDNKHKITIERTDFTGVRVTYPEGIDIRCSVRSLIRVNKSDNDIAWKPHKHIDISKINYFGNDQAVEVSCSIGKGKFGAII